MSTVPLTLLAILAHPDDESMGVGGTLARYASEGIATHLICATRGERGWFGDPAAYPGPVRLGQLRERELAAAAEVLGVRSVRFLDEMDGELDNADPARVIARIATGIRELRPDVVITFGPDGAYGHPDHIAISQFTTAAVLAAADASDTTVQGRPHRVRKLYYAAFRAAETALYRKAFGELAMEIDGVRRSSVVWPDWAISAHLDTTANWRQVWQAVRCHESQLPGIAALAQLPEADHRTLWGNQTFYRALSDVVSSRAVEDDLFAGLRSTLEAPSHLLEESIVF